MIQLLQPYDPIWHQEFLQLKEVLVNEIRDYTVTIEHIGSTAIPGLIAKPILDVDIIIRDKHQLNRTSSTLEKLGYINKGDQGIAGRFAFRQSNNKIPITPTCKEWIQHHLYLCFSDSLALKNHLLFRDALLGNQELVTNYSNLKKKLVEEPGMTREKYSVKKTTFILSVLENLGFKLDELDAIRQANS